MKTLYLLRHAHAEGGMEKNDADRALSTRGQAECAVIGAYVKAHGLCPALALLSPSRRTMETFARICAAAEIDPVARQIKKFYLAAPEDILDSLRMLEDAAASTLIVAHNPGLHQLALLLAEPGDTPMHQALRSGYPAACLTRLEFPLESWRLVRPHLGRLQDRVTP
jgi:phosphohistidine phosphatase